MLCIGDSVTLPQDFEFVDYVVRPQGVVHVHILKAGGNVPLVAESAGAACVVLIDHAGRKRVLGYRVVDAEAGGGCRAAMQRAEEELMRSGRRDEARRACE